MTLARLQQCLTLGAGAAALLWGVVVWRAGHPGWALAGAALIVGGYALVLGLEFTMLAFVHRDDPTPRASPRQLLRAWWGEVVSAPRVFCWRQPFFGRRWPDLLPPDARGRRGVLLVHGYVCNRGLWNPWLERYTQSGTPFVAVNLEPIFGSIDDTLAVVESGVRRLEQATGLAPVIVAHSMGGLVVRRWWAEQGDDARVHRLVTIGTPHRGTWLARFAGTMNAREMRQQSPWLQTLARREPAGRAARTTCFYSHCDNIVFPAQCATLPGADNRHVPGCAHVHLADHPLPWAAVQALLQALVPAPAAAAPEVPTPR